MCVLFAGGWKNEGDQNNESLKKNDKKQKDQQSEEELQGVIDMYKTSSPDSEHEKDMLQSILTLNDTTTFSDTIDFSVTDSLTVTAPAKSLSLEIATATGGNIRRLSS